MEYVFALPKLNILIELVKRVMKHAGRDHVTITDTVTRVANESYRKIRI